MAKAKRVSTAKQREQVRQLAEWAQRFAAGLDGRVGTTPEAREAMTGWIQRGANTITGALASVERVAEQAGIVVDACPLCEARGEISSACQLCDGSGTVVRMGS